MARPGACAERGVRHSGRMARAAVGGRAGSVFRATTSRSILHHEPVDLP
jgi:hypothetical protein